MASAHRVPIGDRIRGQRRAAGVTQRELASAVGVSPAYLSLIESDKRQIGGRLLHRIAGELGVPAETFTAVRDERLAADLAEVAHHLPSEVSEPAASLVAFSPGWARTVLELHDRALTAERRAFRLADRFARDPTWTSFAHDLLSRITSIRSTAEILEAADVPPDDRARFTGAVAAESARLSDVARDLLAALTSGSAADPAGADVREVDAFLHDRDNHFAPIEAALEAAPPPLANGTPAERFAAARLHAAAALGAAIDAAIGTHAFSTAGAAKRARGALERYAAAAALMPYRPFRAAAVALRYDVDALAERFGTSFEQAAHRLTTLRRRDEAGVPFAFLRVDPAGTVSKRLSTPALRLPLFGACPLWVVYEAFAAPGRTLCQLVDLAGHRFLFIARAIEKAPRRQAQPPSRFSVMIGLEAARMDEVVYGDAFASGRDSLVTHAGYECLSCERKNCPQRAHGPGAG